jgi:transcriptional repressor NrdR
METSSFIVIKKDNSRENYSREKLERGIWKACEKRPVTKEQVDRLIGDLEEEWLKMGKEIPAKTIGEAVMERMRRLDEVSYIRFASVYRHFRDIETFKKELQKLLD